MRSESSYGLYQHAANGNVSGNTGPMYFEAARSLPRAILRRVVQDDAPVRWIVYPALIGLVLGGALAWAHRRGRAAD